MKKLIFTVLLCAAPAAAQLLNFGVRGGLPLNSSLDTSGRFSGGFSHWTLGPTAELNLPFGFGLEADLLYRRIGYDDANQGKQTSSAFTVPILLKYKFPGRGPARVFVDTGVAYRGVTGAPMLDDGQTKGFVLGGGIRYDLKAFKFSPELRYTRWADDMYRVASSAGALNSRKNQVELLFGITF